MRRGEIRWYKLNAPDKQRPVLLLTRDSAIEFLSEVTVAPVTGTVRDIPSEVVLSTKDGMPRSCALNFDHLQTVSKARLGAVLTTLGSARWKEVEDALGFALGFLPSH